MPLALNLFYSTQQRMHTNLPKKFVAILFSDYELLVEFMRLEFTITRDMLTSRVVLMPYISWFANKHAWNWQQQG